MGIYDMMDTELGFLGMMVAVAVFFGALEYILGNETRRRGR